MLIIILIITSLFTPQPETGTLYLYRVEEAPRIESQKVKVYLDNARAFDFPEQQCIAVRLPVGQYVVKMKGRASETPINLEAGGVYYLRVSRVSKGLSGFTESVHPMEPQQALHHMRDMRPLEDKNIKIKGLNVVRSLPWT